MNIREPLKEVTTIVVGLPLAFVSAGVATIALVVNWLGAGLVERLVRH
jgi:hypothetical protein